MSNLKEKTWIQYEDIKESIDKLGNRMMLYAKVECLRLDLKLIEFRLEWKNLRKKLGLERR